MRLSEEQLSFLAAFGHSPEGRRFTQLLEAMLLEADAKLRTATGEEVLRTQGRALALADLVGDIRDAQQRLNRSGSTRTSALRPAA